MAHSKLSRIFAKKLLKMPDDERNAFFEQEGTEGWRDWYDKERLRSVSDPEMGLAVAKGAVGAFTDPFTHKIETKPSIDPYQDIVPGFEGEIPTVEPTAAGAKQAAASGMHLGFAALFPAFTGIAGGLEGGLDYLLGGAPPGHTGEIGLGELGEAEPVMASPVMAETIAESVQDIIPIAAGAVGEKLAHKGVKSAAEFLKTGKAPKLDRMVEKAIPRRATVEMQKTYKPAETFSVKPRKAKDALDKSNRLVAFHEDAAAKAQQKIKEMNELLLNPAKRRKAAGKYKDGPQGEIERQKFILFQSTKKAKTIQAEIDLAKAQLNAHIKTGGSTFGPQGDMIGQNLEMFGVGKPTELARRPTASDFLEARVKYADDLSQPDTYLGSYYDKSRQIHEIGPAKGYQDVARAQEEAFGLGEKSTYNLLTRRETPISQSLAPLGEEVTVRRPMPVSRKEPLKTEIKKKARKPRPTDEQVVPLDRDVPFQAEPKKLPMPDETRGLKPTRVGGREERGFFDESYQHTEGVRVEFPDGTVHYDQIKGLNRGHALSRAKDNWEGARIQSTGTIVERQKPPAGSLEEYRLKKARRKKPGEGDALDMHRTDTEGFLRNERGGVKLPDAMPKSAAEHVDAGWEAAGRELEGNVRSTMEHVKLLDEHLELHAAGGRGAIPKDARQLQYEARKAEIPNLVQPGRKISEVEIAAGQQRLWTLHEQMGKLRKDIKTMDLASELPESDIVVQSLLDDLTRLEKEFEQAATTYGKDIHVWHRSGMALQEAIPPEARVVLQRIMGNAGHLRRMKAGKPLYEAIWARAKKIGKGELSAKEYNKLMGDIVDAWRFNLFSTSSFTLDTMGNASEFLSQVIGLGGRDLYKVAKYGDASFEGMHAVGRALKRRYALRGQKLGRGIDARMGHTAYGEELKTAYERGIFLSRTTPVRSGAETFISAPLRLKGAADTAGKRLGFSMQVELELGEMANKLGLTRLNKKAFIENGWSNLTDDIITRAAERGNKMGFNRELSKFEEMLAKQWAVKMVIPFPRWPMQFTRAMGEWFGANPELIRGLWNGTIKGERAAELFTKGLTGWGGVAFVTHAMYDNIDFNTMEYVWDDGTRTRLAARDPLPTIFYLAAVMQGAWPDARAVITNTEVSESMREMQKKHKTRAKAARQFTSLPGMAMGGQSGVLGGLIRYQQETARNPNRENHERWGRELSRIVEKAIPGQALLKSLRFLVDPSQREGPFKSLPGVSYTQRLKIDPTTGEPEVKRETFLGVESTPVSQGMPMPGGVMQLNPIRATLNVFKEPIYKLPKKPLQGKLPREWTTEMKDQYWKAFGQARQQYLGPIAARLQQQGYLSARGPSTQDEYENLRAQVRAADKMAMNQAYWALYKIYGNKWTGERRPTGREQLAPLAGIAGRRGRRRRSRERQRR